MKKVVVLSDTHGNVSDLKKIADILKECDIIFHLGDGYHDLDALGLDILKKTVRVVGNCDAVAGEREILTDVEGVRVLLTHGDLYGVKRDKTRLFLRAKETGASVAFYGHTHAKNIEIADGITIANPGTLHRYSTEKSFIYAVFQNGKATLTINDKAFI